MKTLFHFTPAQGWLNDPNGLIEHRGVHHLFFQHNPTELAMRDMCWGHATSTDLLTWVEQPIALTPGPAGSYDDGGCWSGCAVHDGDAVVAVYSAHHDGIELPSVARPLDEALIAWQKTPGNPVIDHRPPVPGITDMRDHSVRWDGQRWQQVLAGGAAGEGMLFGYSSPDLVDWSWEGIVLRATDAGLPGRVWECPDVFAVAEEVVAIISLIDDDRSPVIWVTGILDGAQITPRRWGLVDYGDRLYAPQSYTDSTGRRLMFGWLRTHLDPAAAGQESLGVISLPRVLTVVDGCLHQQPASELRRLRAAPQSRRPGPDERQISMGCGDARAVEIRIECKSTEDLLSLEVDVDDGAGHRMTVPLACFRDAYRLPDGGDPRADAAAARAATIVFDSGIVEAFLDDGRAAALTDASVIAAAMLRLRWTGSAPDEATVWVLEAPDMDSADLPAGRGRTQVDLGA